MTPDFTDAVRSHRRRLFRFAYKLTDGDIPAAEDVLQDALLEAWRAWGKAGDVENIEAWLMTMVRRAYNRTIRTHAARLRGASLPIEDSHHPSVPPSQHAVAEVSQIGRLLETFPGRHGRVFTAFVTGNSYAEIAEDEGVSTERVRQILTASRQRLERLTTFTLRKELTLRS